MIIQEKSKLNEQEDNIIVEIECNNKEIDLSIPNVLNELSCKNFVKFNRILFI